MNVMNGLRRPDGLTLVIGAAAALGAALVLARQVVSGPVVYVDSIFYIAVARNLLDGGGFVGLGGEVSIVEPPFQQVMLAAASGLGLVDPYSVAGPMNAAIFALIIFAVGRYLQRRLASGYLAAWACFALALAMPMVEQMSIALTGPPFILLGTLALIRADDYLGGGKMSALLWAAALSALAWLTRYVGMLVVGVIGLALLLQAGAPLGDRLRRCVVLGLIAGLPMAAWLLRNYLLTGKFTGYLPSVDYSLAELALEARGRFWHWVYFNPDWVRVDGLAFLPAASAALLLGALGAIGVGWLLAYGFGGARMPERASRACWLFGGFAAAYVALFVVSYVALGRPQHGVEARYLTPLYAPLVVVAVVVADRLLVFLRVGGLRDGGIGRRWRGLRRLAGAGLLAALTLWALAQVVPNARAIAWYNSDEFYYGYGGRNWSGSELLRHIRENPMDGEVHANYSFGRVLLHNRGKARHYGLNALDYETDKEFTRMADWAADAADGAWLVWFKGYYGTPALDEYLPYLRVMEGLRPIVELPDGAIFRVDKDYRPDMDGNRFVAAYEGVAARDLVASAYADFNVYWDGGRVIYLREDCAPQDIDARFLLHIYPAADAAGLRDERGFVNSDFDFAEYGALFDGKCVAIAPLPDYGVERIVTGQHIGGAEAWRVDVGPDSANRLSVYADAYRAADAGEYGTAAAYSDFAVYWEDSRVIYLREDCDPQDIDARFLLHIYPTSDAAVARNERGFVNADFDFAEYGALFDGKCVAIAPLPDYGIERIVTGQHVGGDQAWRVDVGPGSASALGVYAAAYRAAEAGEYGEAAARSDFDVYRAGVDALVYVKEPCDPADVEARFFLHIVPADAADLPAGRAESGFDNLDLLLEDGVEYLGGKCVGIARLPDYPIGRVWTGQHVGGEGAVWRVEFGWE